MPSRKFPRQLLIDWDIPHSDACVSDEVVDSTRWMNVNECIFKAPDDGNLYRLYYESGLTEYQEVDWYEELADPELLEEVYKVTKLVEVTEWLLV
jgi:hypothetical protein